jgi:hypothetical protein
MKTADDYLRNQAAHWAGGCAFDREERRHEVLTRCECGNCGAYRNFLAALTRAYAMGRADELAQGAPGARLTASSQD